MTLAPTLEPGPLVPSEGPDERARRTPALLLLAGALVAALALVPLGFVAVYTVLIGPAEAWELLARPRVLQLLTNTLSLMAGVTTLCLVLGVGAAWVVERTDLRFRPLWHGLLVAPLAVPAFVNSYSWASLSPEVKGYGGALLVVTLSYYPLVYLPVVATLRGLDPALEEAAYSLEHDRWRTFRRVVLPQLRPGMLGGALLVALHLLAEFGALQMLQFPTFTTAIYDLYGSTFNGPAANMIAGVLVLCCLLLLTAELRLRGHRRYARVSHGAARPPERLRLGAAGIPVALLLGALVVAAVGVPTYSLVHWLRVGSSTEFPVGELAAAAGTSLGLGAAAALLTVLLALPVAWLAVRYRNAASTIVERSTYVANALPGIVVALALVTVSIRVAQPLYQTFALLLVAYAILFLPRAVVSVRAALEQAPVVLDDVAHSLGAGPIATARRVTLPIIAPGLGAGAALVFLAVATELTATLMLAPIDTATLATKFWSASSSVAYGAAAPYALLLVLISIPATILLGRHASLSTPSGKEPTT
ncbi:ABC transporter permease [Nocardioides sp. GCM10027113]|uniref:ABC transporter permease n=1 Tax=unclassified Nocardioides TaxID=2615069 RepID=UPI003613CBB2